MDWKLCGYNILLVLLSPYILWRKAKRARSRRTSHEFDWQRWVCNNAEYSDAGKTRVVLLCTGLGEVLIAAELTSRLQKQRADLEILWSIRRSDVRELAGQKYPQQKTVTLPFDFFWPCRKWLSRARPNLIVSIERLWWPNLFWLARHSGISTMVVAGTDFSRITFPAWSRINHWTLRGLDKIGLQNESEKEKLAELLPPGKTCVTGALKWFEQSGPNGSTPQALSLKNWMNPDSQPVLIAGSTHDGEEEFVLQAFEKVRRECDCRLLIAPRQLHRVENIVERCHATGWSTQQRSQSNDANDISNPADVLILDTMGELALSYRFARAAFIGGTLRGAGHNLLEPLTVEVPVAFGSGGKNKLPTDLQQATITAGIGRRVETPEALAEFWKSILQNEEMEENHRTRFEKFRQSQLAAWDKTVSAILEQIDATKNSHS